MVETEAKQYYLCYWDNHFKNLNPSLWYNTLKNIFLKKYIYYYFNQSGVIAGINAWIFVKELTAKYNSAVQVFWRLEWYRAILFDMASWAWLD